MSAPNSVAIREAGKMPLKLCRVAHLHSTLGIYGAERWTFALIKHLNVDEIESFVVTIGTKPGADSFYQLLRLNKFQAFHLAIPGKLNPRIAMRLRQFLIDHRIDVLHTHGFKADVIGYLTTRGMPVKLVSTIHGWSTGEGRIIRTYEAISRVFLRRFDRVFPLSPGLLQGLEEKRFDPLKLRLVLNGVDLSALNFNFRERGLKDPIEFLFAGRLCKPKGVIELVHAFARAKFDVPAKLRIVGDGPDRTELEALCKSLGISDNVQFFGAVPSITPYLETSNALILPSHSEGIPRVVMEAFAAGVPVIGTAIPGIQLLVNDEDTGFLVPVRSPELLARAMEKMAVRPELARKMAINAREVVIAKYSANRMGEDFRKEYQQLSC